MLNPEDDHAPRSQSAGRPLLSIGAMAFARTVRAEYQEMETGYRNGRYGFLARALTSYRKLLKEPGSDEELCAEDNISPLREKPALERTSRLALYFHTGARDEAERNTAGKYARIVDYLHQEHIISAAAADYIRDEGGIDAMLQTARGHEMPKESEGDVVDTQQGDQPEPDGRDGGNETPTHDSGSRHETDKIFDRKKDLSIRGLDEMRARVLAPEIRMNEPFYLECKKVALIGRDGVRIVGRLVDRPSE
jgi:hypothetical protein